MTETETPRGIPSVVSVALIGAPGVGKSEVASLFAEKAGEELGAFRVLDDYPQIVNDLGLATGIYGDYRVTNLIHNLRWSGELQALKDETNYVSVGTAYSSLAHGALLVEILQQGLQSPDTEQRILPEVHSTMAMSLWIMSTFSYRYGFYIPRAQGLEVVGEAGPEAQERTYADRVDMCLQVAFQKFQQVIQRLDGAPEQMADQMIETVMKIEREIRADEHPSLNPDGTFRASWIEEQQESLAAAQAEAEMAAQEAEGRPSLGPVE